MLLKPIEKYRVFLSISMISINSTRITRTSPKDEIKHASPNSYFFSIPSQAN